MLVDIFAIITARHTDARLASYCCSLAMFQPAALVARRVWSRSVPYMCRIVIVRAELGAILRAHEICDHIAWWSRARMLKQVETIRLSFGAVKDSRHEACE